MGDEATTVISMPLLRLIARLTALSRRAGFDGDALTGYLTHHGDPHHLAATFIAAPVPCDGLTVLAPRADGWSAAVMAALAPGAERLERLVGAVPAGGAMIGQRFSGTHTEPVVWADAAWSSAELAAALTAWGVDAATRAVVAEHLALLPDGDGDALRTTGAGPDARVEIRRALRVGSEHAGAIVALAERLGIDGHQLAFLRDGFEALFPPGDEHRTSIGLVVRGDRLAPELVIDLEGLTGAWASALLAGFGHDHEIDAAIAALEAAAGASPDGTGACPIDAVTLAFDDQPASPRATLGWFVTT